nr:hypothetical protein [Kibdelosporangium sp. MJ126-NF4]CTQ90154.1 hypothetical protein [Kibdelosporangium sp. MJ126-NF4]
MVGSLPYVLPEETTACREVGIASRWARQFRRPTSRHAVVWLRPGHTGGNQPRTPPMRYARKASCPPMRFRAHSAVDIGLTTPWWPGKLFEWITSGRFF